MDSGETTVREFVVVADKKWEFLEGGFTRAVHLDHMMEEAKDGSIKIQLEVLSRSRPQTVE